MPTLSATSDDHINQFLRSIQDLDAKTSREDAERTRRMEEQLAVRKPRAEVPQTAGKPMKPAIPMKPRTVSEHYRSLADVPSPAAPRSFAEVSAEVRHKHGDSVTPVKVENRRIIGSVLPLPDGFNKSQMGTEIGTETPPAGIPYKVAVRPVRTESAEPSEVPSEAEKAGNLEEFNEISESSEQIGTTNNSVPGFSDIVLVRPICKSPNSRNPQNPQSPATASWLNSALSKTSHSISPVSSVPKSPGSPTRQPKPYSVCVKQVNSEGLRPAEPLPPKPRSEFQLPRVPLKKTLSSSAEPQRGSVATPKQETVPSVKLKAAPPPPAKKPNLKEEFVAEPVLEQMRKLRNNRPNPGEKRIVSGEKPALQKLKELQTRKDPSAYQRLEKRGNQRIPSSSEKEALKKLEEMNSQSETRPGGLHVLERRPTLREYEAADTRDVLGAKSKLRPAVPVKKVALDEPEAIRRLKQLKEKPMGKEDGGGKEETTSAGKEAEKVSKPAEDPLRTRRENFMISNQNSGLISNQKLSEGRPDVGSGDFKKDLSAIFSAGFRGISRTQTVQSNAPRDTGEWQPQPVTRAATWDASVGRKKEEKLQHLTKSRARGPKRKLPKSVQKVKESGSTKLLESDSKSEETAESSAGSGYKFEMPKSRNSTFNPQTPSRIGLSRSSTDREISEDQEEHKPELPARRKVVIPSVFDQPSGSPVVQKVDVSPYRAKIAASDHKTAPPIRKPSGSVVIPSN